MYTYQDLLAKDEGQKMDGRMGTVTMQDYGLKLYDLIGG